MPDHANLVAYVLGTVEFASAGADEAVLISVPPYHIAGISSVFLSLYAGRRMVMLPAFTPEAWLDAVDTERITYAFVVPTMLGRIVEALDRGHPASLASLRAISYGGGRMPPDLIAEALDRFPDTAFTNAYGLTETSSTIALLGPRGAPGGSPFG